MKKVIWGTGFYASLFTLKLGRDNISFYIDKDKRKTGYFLGKKVVTPDKINNWENMYIYIPYNYYEEISSFLKGKGLIENVSFSKYNEYVCFTIEEAEKDFVRACREVDELGQAHYNMATVWCGSFWARRAEYRNCLKELKTRGNEFVILANTPWYKKTEIENELQCPAIVMPLFMQDFVSIDDGEANGDIVEEVCSDKSIMNLFENVMVRNKNSSRSSCMYRAKRSADFMNYLLKRYKFKYFILGGSDSAINKLIRDKCQEYKTVPLFTHQGVIPGTIMMGPGGDIGDSVPSVYYKEFRQLPVDEMQTQKAKSVWDYLNISRANRKVQPQNNVAKELKKSLRNERPIILCLGQNDLDSTLIPYTEESKTYQSPIFKSSMESVLFLSDICEKEDWNLIYKPHPVYARFEDHEKLPDNVKIVLFGDINEMIDMADVVVTIRSSSNYISLIRYKPVLMLGYTQTRGQGGTYEAFCKEEIEPQLKLALRYGFTKAQEQAFLEHLARMLKYYLYDDMSDRPIRYGLPYPSKIEDFFSLENRLKSMGSNKGQKRGRNNEILKKHK